MTMDVQSSDRLHPVMSDAEIDCYLRHLRRANGVLEYGVGGSTVLAAEHGVKSLYSLDTDANWLAKTATQSAVSKMIAAGNARLVHVDLGPVGKWGWPKAPRYIHRWPIYARRPWRDGFKPDLVLVDGRFRVSCVMQCLLHGGSDLKIAVHDFWRRPFYHRVLQFASVVDRVDTLVVLRANGSDNWYATVLRLRHALDRR
jgi:hypothetical protein